MLHVEKIILIIIIKKKTLLDAVRIFSVETYLRNDDENAAMMAETLTDANCAWF